MNPWAFKHEYAQVGVPPGLLPGAKLPPIKSRYKRNQKPLHESIQFFAGNSLL